MNTPLISIIIPTYNSATTIVACLESLLIQKFTDFEVVIVDGLSIDETVTLVKSYRHRACNFNLVSERDNGIYDAMNKGIRKAKGEWVYFLGSDDRLANESSLKMISESLTGNWDIVYGDTTWIPGNTVEMGTKDLSELLKTCINHQRIFYRKKLFQKFGLYNTKYKIAADYEMNIRMFCDKDVRKKYEPVSVAFYYSGGLSATKIDESFWEDWRINVLKNFSPSLPLKEIYHGLEWYCWYLLNQREYKKSLYLFIRIYFSGFSFKFLKHSVSQALHVGRQGMS